MPESHRQSFAHETDSPRFGMFVVGVAGSEIERFASKSDERAVDSTKADSLTPEAATFVIDSANTNK